MNIFRTWFTPARREAIYAGIAALAPLLVSMGFLASEQVEPILIIVAAVLQTLMGILQLTTLRPTEAARWFGTVGRGIIYGGATTVAAAVVALGIIDNDFATTALTYVSFALTGLSAIIGIVTPKEDPAIS
jgi:hypothetical protein